FGQVGVRARGDQTLEVELEAPLVYFPSVVNFMVTFPLRRELVERFGERWTDPGNLVSLGPFTLAEWRHEYRLLPRAHPRAGGRRAALGPGRRHGGGGAGRAGALFGGGAPAGGAPPAAGAPPLPGPPRVPARAAAARLLLRLQHPAAAVRRSARAARLRARDR